MKDLIIDRIQFNLKAADTQKADLMDGIKKIQDAHSGMPALEVVIDATHGGYVNRNYALYTAEGQSHGFKSFFNPFPKPVLVEHDDFRAPIGRVVEADFISIPAGDKPGEPTSKIRMKALVTDLDAIQKILDGRFMTVSIAGRPKASPTCSICSEKVESMFGCENDHMRGQTYDSKVCHYIFGEMEYSEVSFVNKPADQSDTHAAILIGVRAVEAPQLTDAMQKMLTDAIEAARARKPEAAASKDSTDEKPVEPAKKEEPVPVTPEKPAEPAVQEPKPDQQEALQAQVTAANAKVTELQAAKDSIQKELQAAKDAITKATGDHSKETGDLKDGLTKAEERHKNNLAQQADLTNELRQAKARNIIMMQLMLQEESLLSVFAGVKAEERSTSFQKKLSEFKDISLPDLTKKEEELFSKLTKQTILRSDLGALAPGDEKIAKQYEARLGKKERIRRWLNGL